MFFCCAVLFYLKENLSLYHICTDYVEYRVADCTANLKVNELLSYENYLLFTDIPYESSSKDS